MRWTHQRTLRRWVEKLFLTYGVLGSSGPGSSAAGLSNAICSSRLVSFIMCSDGGVSEGLYKSLFLDQLPGPLNT